MTEHRTDHEDKRHEQAHRQPEENSAAALPRDLVRRRGRGRRLLRGVGRRLLCSVALHQLPQPQVLALKLLEPMT